MPKRNLIWILALVATATVSGLLFRPAGRGTPGGDRRFDPVHETYRLIRRNYYRQLETGHLQRVAVRAMAESLDEFSSYVDPCEVEAFSHRVHGLGQGLGLRLQRKDGKWLALGPVPGSPAHLAGVTPGDELLRVDQHELAGLTGSEVRALLSGPLDTQVALTFARAGGEERSTGPVTVTLTRTEFPLETVEGICRDERGRWLVHIDPDRRIGYLRVTEFVSDTGGQFLAAYRRLADPNGLVLDLRDNPGGLLPVAVSLADRFLAEGAILTVRRRGEPNQVYRADPADTIGPVPLVVLINARTASAAEIVAGALGYHARAVLVGSRTRGKGCIQSMFTLAGGLGQINLTTSQFLIATDEPIMRQPGSDRWGVDPHDQRLVALADGAELLALRERARCVRVRAAGGARMSPDELIDAMIARDAPLARAIEILANPAEHAMLLDRARARTLRRHPPPPDAAAGPAGRERRR